MYSIISNALNRGAKAFAILASYITQALPKQVLCFSDQKADIYVNIKSDALLHDNGRYLFVLLKTLSLRYSSIAVNSFSLISYYKMGGYGRNIYTINNLYFRSRLPNNRSNKTLIYDQPLSDKTLSGWRKCIRIESNISLPKPVHNQWMLMPYSMHPKLYSLVDQKSLKQLRNGNRKIRIFFSGSIDPKTYSGRGFWKKTDFNLMPRAQIIAAIKSNLSDKVCLIKSQQELMSAMTSDSRGKLILSDRKQFSVPQKQWLSLLSDCDFFICPPGIDMPLCHNAIEAMAVGSIPLINYPNWFSPNLRDFQNCIVFKDETELIEKIQMVLAMPQEQILAIRKNVIDYYERYLNLDIFYQQLMNAKPKQMTLFINLGNRKILQQITPMSTVWG